MGNELKVVSWNVLYSNTNHDGIVAHIRAIDADVVCLQEVSNELLEKLRTLPYELASGIDVIFISDAHHPEKGETTTHVVILSKLPISKNSTYPMPQLPPYTARVRFFNALLYMVGIWRGDAFRDKQAISVDLEVAGKKLRVFCAHLSLFTPAIRLAEFEVVTESLLPQSANIIAGDFNILESPYIKVWNWMRGGRLREAMPWASERKGIEKVFNDSGLKNPLRGLVTHPISDSQLDHILVSENVEVTSRAVGKERYGSDHAPVQLTVTI